MSTILINLAHFEPYIEDLKFFKLLGNIYINSKLIDN